MQKQSSLLFLSLFGSTGALGCEHSSQKSAKAQPFLASLQDAFLRGPVPGVFASLQPPAPEEHHVGTNANTVEGFPKREGEA